MKSFITYFLFLLLFTVSMLTINSCNSNPVIPVKPDNIFCTVSGAYNFNYHSPSAVWNIGDTTTSSIQMLMPGRLDSNGIIFNINISVFYKDMIQKTGTFQITDNPSKIQGDYANSLLTITYSGKEKDFIADTGWVILTKSVGYHIQGTFWFNAKNPKDSTEIIQVTNGILNINN